LSGFDPRTELGAPLLKSLKERKKMEFEKIQEIISDTMGIAPEKIMMSTSFTEDLGADSLDIYQIIYALENAFEVKFLIEDADKIRTVGDAVSYIRNAV
jgi:acyl carrier protein